MVMFSRCFVLVVCFCLVVLSSAEAKPPKPPTTQPQAAAMRPWSHGVDPRLLHAWVEQARQANSDALVVLRNGKLVGHWTFGRKRALLETMSVTKSIVGMGVGCMVDQGKIKSIDVPLSTFFPSWKTGQHARVTLRHILTHTSGLATKRNTRLIYKSKDFVKYALAGKILHPPGLRFRYNNRAINLLAGVFKRATGIRMDRYIASCLFVPLGIRSFRWTLDRAGNPHAMSGLQLGARDLAKLGQLMLDGGVYKGKRILSAKWVKLSTRPHPHKMRRYGRHPHGLLWWLLPAPWVEVIDDAVLASWRKAGLPAAIVKQIASLKGRRFAMDPWDYFRSRRALYAALRAVLGRNFRPWRRFLSKHKLQRATRYYGPSYGFAGEGYLGQYLVVLPRLQMVVVRQIHARHADGLRTSMRRFHYTLARMPMRFPAKKAHLPILRWLYQAGLRGPRQPDALPKVVGYTSHAAPLVREVAFWTLERWAKRAISASPYIQQNMAKETVKWVKARALAAWIATGSVESRKGALALLQASKAPWHMRVAAAKRFGTQASTDQKLAEELLFLFRQKAFSYRLKLVLANAWKEVPVGLTSELEKVLQLRRDPGKVWAARLLLVQAKEPDIRRQLALRFLSDLHWGLSRVGRRALVKMGSKARVVAPQLRVLYKRTRSRFRRRLLLRLMRQIGVPLQAPASRPTTRPIKRK